MSCSFPPRPPPPGQRVLVIELDSLLPYEKCLEKIGRFYNRTEGITDYCYNSEKKHLRVAGTMNMGELFGNLYKQKLCIGPPKVVYDSHSPHPSSANFTYNKQPSSTPPQAPSPQPHPPNIPPPATPPSSGHRSHSSPCQPSGSPRPQPGHDKNEPPPPSATYCPPPPEYSLHTRSKKSSHSASSSSHAPQPEQADLAANKVEHVSSRGGKANKISHNAKLVSLVLDNIPNVDKVKHIDLIRKQKIRVTYDNDDMGITNSNQPEINHGHSSYCPDAYAQDHYTAEPPPHPRYHSPFSEDDPNSWCSII